MVISQLFTGNMRMRICILFCLLAFAVSFPCRVAGQDSIQVITVKRAPQKEPFFKRFAAKFDVAPHYSSEMGVGVAFSYTFSKGFALIGNATSKGYLLFGGHGAATTKNGKWNFIYNGYYNYAPSYYWGLGYGQANISANRSRFNQKKLSVHADALYNFTPHFKFGPSLGYEQVKWENFKDGNLSSMVLEYGLSAQFDKRDSKISPSRGVYAVARQRNYTNLSGSTSLQFCSYVPVWDGGVMALDMYSVFAYGNVPVTMLPTIGGTERMRGYHYGRYRDNNIVSAQLELRQHIWEMIGGAVWVGGANLWGDYGKFNIANTLPNYGIGARIAVTDQLKLRLDYGFGRKGQNAFIFSINEAF